MAALMTAVMMVGRLPRPSRLPPLTAVRMMAKGNVELRDVVDAVTAGEAVLLDVREDHEWQEAHFLHATHLPLSSLAKAVQYGVLPDVVDDTSKIYVHCAKGVRVHTAAPLLAHLGCTDVHPLSVSFEDLIASGLPLEPK